MFEFAANLSLMFCERPLLERFAAARAAGFDTVELQFPYTEDAARLAQAARDAQVDIVLINAPVTEQFPFGIGCLPDLGSEFRSTLGGLVDYARALGVKHVNVLAGQAGGRSATECRATLIANLLLAAERLEPLGVGVLLEPINAHDVPDYFVSDFVRGREIVDACGGRVGLQFDLYHAARMGLDPRAELARSLAMVRHVQFADAPGRHEPGTGALRFEPVWALLRKASYDGCVSAEYRPSTRTEDTVGWLNRWREL
jgi:hydroxypyruvate isomerase